MRSRFCGGRKPECPEKILRSQVEIDWNSIHIQHFCSRGGRRDWCFYNASLTSQEVQHRVCYPDRHPSRYQPYPTELNFGEQTGTGVFPVVIAVPTKPHNLLAPYNLFLVLSSTAEPWNENVFWKLAPEVTEWHNWRTDVRRSLANWLVTKTTGIPY